MKYFILILILIIGDHSFAQNLQHRSDAKIVRQVVKQNTPFDNIQLTNLTNLGMLWGFIKYYHANVQSGAFDMDEELFNILPSITSASSKETANEEMEKWLDHFGKPDSCLYCNDTTPNSKIKLAPDYGYLLQPANFSNQFISKIKYIINNRDTNSRLHYYVGKTTIVGDPYFRNEKSYDSVFPDARTRLLGLYRYWNIIQYFYPNRHLINCNWNNALTMFIPEFYTAADTSKYLKSCARLIASLRDAHAPLGGTLFFSSLIDSKVLPLRAQFWDGKLIVVQYIDTMNIAENIQKGDEILKINGVPVHELVKQNIDNISWSNYTGYLARLSSQVGPLLTSKKDAIDLAILRNGRAYTISLPTFRPTKQTVIKPENHVDIHYKLVAKDILWVAGKNAYQSDIDSIKKYSQGTKGLILDMRGHPHIEMVKSYCNWLKCNPSAFWKSAAINLSLPGRFEYVETEKVGKTGTDCYKGKVVILVDGTTFSAAELASMAFSTINGAVVIGDTTAGADGNISFFTLPGGVTTAISGISVLYPDGTETQRVGIKVDRYVKPTLDAVLKGKDELLDEAVRILNSK